MIARRAHERDGEPAPRPLPGSTIAPAASTITLDEATVALLWNHRSHVASELDRLGLKLTDDAYLFSRDPDRSTWLRPSSVSQRYARMCKRLGWDMDIKELRHYSATELIAVGVDVRTVAGRLGHG